MKNDEENSDVVFEQAEATLGETFQNMNVSEFTALLKEIEQFEVKISVRDGKYILGGRWSAMQEINQFLSKKCARNRGSKLITNSESEGRYTKAEKCDLHSTKKSYGVLAQGGAAKSYDHIKPDHSEDIHRYQPLLVAEGSSKKAEKGFNDDGLYDYIEEKDREWYLEGINRNPQRHADVKSGKKQKFKEEVKPDVAKECDDKFRHDSSGYNSGKINSPEKRNSEVKDNPTAAEVPVPSVDPELFNAKDLILDRDIWLYIYTKLKNQLAEVQNFGAKLILKPSDAGTLRVIVSSPQAVDDCDVVSLVHDSLVQLSADVISRIVIEAVNYNIDTLDVTEIMHKYVDEQFPTVYVKFEQKQNHNWYSFIGPATDVAYALAEFRRGVLTGLRTKAQRRHQMEQFDQARGGFETEDVRPRRVKSRSKTSEGMDEVDQEARFEENATHKVFHSADADGKLRQHNDSARNIQLYYAQQNYVKPEEKLKENKFDLSEAMEGKDLCKIETLGETGKGKKKMIQKHPSAKKKADVVETHDIDNVDYYRQNEGQLLGARIHQKSQYEICRDESEQNATSDDKNITKDVKTISPNEDVVNQERLYRTKGDENYDPFANLDDNDVDDNFNGRDLTAESKVVEEPNKFKDVIFDSFHIAGELIAEDNEEPEDDVSAFTVDDAEGTTRELKFMVEESKTSSSHIAGAAIKPFTFLEDHPDREIIQEKVLENSEDIVIERRSSHSSDENENVLMMNRGFPDEGVSDKDVINKGICDKDVSDKFAFEKDVSDREVSHKGTSDKSNSGVNVYIKEHSDHVSVSNVSDKDIPEEDVSDKGFSGKDASDLVTSSASAEAMTAETPTYQELIKRLTVMIEGDRYFIFAAEQADLHLAGYEEAGTIIIRVEYKSETPDVSLLDDYDEEDNDDIDQTIFEAYIPATAEGRYVTERMQDLFVRRRLFNRVNGGKGNCTARIELKTSLTGANGYPDDTYLRRLKDQMKMIKLQD